MSYKKEKIHALNGLNFSNFDRPQLQETAQTVLENGLHGLCFSPYGEGQQPGTQVQEDQVCRRLEIIRPYTKWIRTFSCTEGHEYIPKLAKSYGLKTLVGAWLGKDDAVNEKEIEGLIQLASEGFVDVAAVGNEVMYRGDFSESKLLDYMARVKAAIPSIPVGYVDAYYEFTDRP